MSTFSATFGRSLFAACARAPLRTNLRGGDANTSSIETKPRNVGPVFRWLVVLSWCGAAAPTAQAQTFAGTAGKDEPTLAFDAFLSSQLARVSRVQSGTRGQVPSVQAGAVRTVTATASFSADGLGPTTVDVPLSAPVSLEGVTYVIWEAITVRLERTSGFGDRYALLDASLLANETEIVPLDGSGAFLGGNRASLAVTLRGRERISPSTLTADGLRITVTNFLSNNASGSLDTQVSTIHPGSVVRVHFVYGATEPSGPNRIARVPCTPEQFACLGGVTSWQQFNVTVPADRLRFVFHFFSFGSLFDDGSGSPESQLVLDNGDFLTLDDAFSPSISDAPAAGEGLVTASHSLLLDDSQQSALDGRTIVGWRWRVHHNGVGCVTITPQDINDILFAYDSPECNADGICEPQQGETCNLCPADCTRSQADLDGDCDADLDDFRLFQHAFTGVETP